MAETYLNYIREAFASLVSSRSPWFVEGIEFCITSGTRATMHGQGIRRAGGTGQTSVGYDCAMCAQGVLRGRDPRRRAPGA